MEQKQDIDQQEAEKNTNAELQGQLEKFKERLGEPKVNIASSEDQFFDPKAFDALFEKISVSASSGDEPSPLRKRTATFVLKKEQCRLDTFPSDVKLTIEELDSAVEENAMATLKGDMNELSLMIALAKYSIKALNGRILASHEKELVWECIGFNGRLTTAMEFTENCLGIDGDSVKKSLLSTVIG